MMILFGPPAHPDSGVYCIRNHLTKKMYVGSSVQLKKRLGEHRRVLRHGTHHAVKLQRAWNKYGENCFEFFVMSYLPPEGVRKAEQEWLSSATCEYNSSRDATAPQLSPDARIKLSAKLKEVWATPARREAARQRALKQTSHRSGPLPKAHVEKLRAAHRALHRNYSAFGELWSLKELAEKFGVHYGMLKDRVRAGWEVEAAVTTPKRKGGL